MENEKWDYMVKNSKKQPKKPIGFVVSVLFFCVCLAALVTGIYAAKQQNIGTEFEIIYKSDDAYEFMLNGDGATYTLTSFLKKDVTNYNAKIPGTPFDDGYPVTAIAANVFEGSKIKSVTIPESITSIGNDAFKDCTMLTNIDYRATNVEDFAFADEATNLGAFFNVGTATAGTTLTIADNVTHIPVAIFCAVYVSGNSLTGKSNITSITIGKGVQSIGMYAFAGLTKLTEINFNAINMPDFIEEETLMTILMNGEVAEQPVENMIFALAGQETDGITVNFGDDVQNIPGGLLTPTLPESISLIKVNMGSYPDDDGVLSMVFTFAPNITKINLGNSVNSIGPGAFICLTKIDEIIIPSTMTTIGCAAFAGMHNFWEISYKVSYGEIDVSGLDESEIMSLLASYLSGLTSLTIPESVTYLGPFNLLGDYSLFDITVESENLLILDLSTMDESNAEMQMFMSLYAYLITTREMGASVSESNLNGNFFPNFYVPEHINLEEVSEPKMSIFQIVQMMGFCAMVKSNSTKEGYNYYTYVQTCQLTNYNPECVTVTDINDIPLETLTKGQEIKITIINPSEDFELTVNGAKYNAQTDSYTVLGNVTISYEHPYLTFASVENGYSVAAKNSSISGNIVIPDTYNGLPVVEIVSEGFNNCTGITSITIPKYITTIGDRAFYNCTGLTTINFNAINMPNYIEDEDIMGSSTDENEFKDNYVFAMAGQATNGITLNFGDEVENIPGGLFTPMFKEMRAVVVGDTSGLNDTAAAIEMFKTTPNITHINFGKNVKTIGPCAFMGLTNIDEIVIPTTVTTIGGAAFAGMHNFAEIYLNVTTGAYGELSTPEELANILNGLFKGLSSLIIPSNVTYMGPLAIMGTYSLFNITVENQDLLVVPAIYSSEEAQTELTNGIYRYIMTSLDSDVINVIQMFESYNAKLNLNGNIFPDFYVPESINLDNITDKMSIFQAIQSTGLASMFGETIMKTESDRAGYNKYISVKSFRIVNKTPDYVEVTDLEGSVLQSVYKGQEIKITITNPQEGFELTVTGATYNASTGTYTVMDEVEINYEHPYLVFYSTSGGYGVRAKDTSISGNIVIPSTYAGEPVVAILDSAFSGCAGITGISIPESVTSIGSSTFRGCISLTSLSIPEKVTNIGNYAFYNCTVLTSVTIPESVTSIGYQAFYNCTGLTKITYNANISKDFSDSPFSGVGSSGKGLIVTIGENVNYIPAYLFYKVSNITYLTIGTSVESIGKRAFYMCTGITSLTLSNSVKTVGAYAFSGLSNAQSILNLELTSVGEYAFDGCGKLTGSVTLNCETIGSHAFFGCAGLTTLTIGENVTTIGSDAFSGLTNLTTLNYNANILTDFTNSSNVFYNGGTAGDGITVIIGDNVTNIPTYLFYARYLEPNITNIIIGKGVTTIGDGAFGGLTNLNEVIINSADIYSQLTSSSACGSLTNYIKTGGKIKVLQSADDGSNTKYLGNTSKFTKTTEEIDGVKYNVYSKV